MQKIGVEARILSRSQRWEWKSWSIPRGPRERRRWKGSRPKAEPRGRREAEDGGQAQVWGKELVEQSGR